MAADTLVFIGIGSKAGLYNEVIYGLLKKTYLEVTMSEIINASDPRK